MIMLKSLHESIIKKSKIENRQSRIKCSRARSRNFSTRCAKSVKDTSNSIVTLYLSMYLFLVFNWTHLLFSEDYVVRVAYDRYCSNILHVVISTYESYATSRNRI